MGQIHDDNKTIPITLRSGYKREDELILDLPVESTLLDELVPIGNVASLGLGFSDQQIRRWKRIREVTLGIRTTEANGARIKREISQMAEDLQLPPGYEVSLQGRRVEERNSFFDLIQHLLLAILLIYLILTWRFNSFSQPLLVLSASTIPSSCWRPSTRHLRTRLNSPYKRRLKRNSGLSLSLQ